MLNRVNVFSMVKVGRQRGGLPQELQIGDKRQTLSTGLRSDMLNLYLNG